MFDVFDVVLVIAAGVLIAALTRIAYDLGREDGREETIRDIAASRLRMMADAADRPPLPPPNPDLISMLDGPLREVDPKEYARLDAARQPALSERLREWLDKLAATPWREGFSDDYKRGYDTALEEVWLAAGQPALSEGLGTLNALQVCAEALALAEGELERLRTQPALGPAEDRPATRDGEPARPPYESL